MKTKPETFAKPASHLAAVFAAATLALVITAAATQTAHAATTITETVLRYDFQKATVGAPPPNAGTTGVLVKYPTRPDGGTAGNDNTTLVSTAGSTASSATTPVTPADPFGGSGNLSGYLWYHKQVSSSKMPVLQFALPNYTAVAPLTTGTLSFDFYMPTPVDGTGIMEINIMPDTSNSDSTRGTSLVSFQVQGSTTDGYGTVFIYTNGETSGNQARATTATVSFDAKHTFAITWDAATSSFSMKLDGTTVERSVSGSLVSSFVSTTNQTGAAAVRFTTASGGGNTSVGYFVDNILVTHEIPVPVPEPAKTAAALGVITAAIAAAANLFARKNKPSA
ncbi:hypothetical protein [Geminisphaera colitermitum]|uniref:hypothetical protein n=1 Tax=Geminisphaera colitermitum TaxID=1148786 RepID=UPI000158D4D4|nr:hypothetical protein [Geminisphaera colitermitum]